MFNFNSDTVTGIFIGGLPLFATIAIQLIIECIKHIRYKRLKYLELYYIPKRDAIIDYMSKLGSVAGHEMKDFDSKFVYQAAFQHACLFVKPTTKKLMEEVNRKFEELCEKNVVADMMSFDEMVKLRNALNAEIFLDDRLKFTTHYPNED